MQLVSLQYCSLLGLCEWPVLAQRGDLDRSPASSLNAGRVAAGHMIWKRFLKYAPGSFSEGKPSPDNALHSVGCKWPTFCMPLPS